MTVLLLVLLSLSCAGVLLLGFSKPLRMLQYPFAAAGVFAGWVLPQLIGLSNSPRIPQAAIDKTIFMTMLCVVAIYLGDRVGQKSLKTWNWRFTQRRLLVAATIFSLFGGYFFYRVSVLAEVATAEFGGQWSGAITIYVFFASTVTFGLVLCLVSFFQRPSRWAMLLILFDLSLYLHRIVMSGRRQAAAELVVITGLVLWFRFRRLPPRSIVAVVLVIGALWVNSVGQYRYVVMNDEGGGFREVLSIDYLKNFQTIFTTGGHEVMNAVFDIEGTDRLSTFDFGLSHWNGFVHAYIPGQLIGHDLKNKLMVDLVDSARKVFQHVAHTGTTHTGMADAFRSFWYFGAIKFFIIAFVMARLWNAANGGHVVAQMLVMLVFTGALESITHTTDRFFMIWPKVLVFLLPALWYARIRYRHSTHRYANQSSPLARVEMAKK